MSEAPVKLNLASGTDLRPRPWVNLDLVSQWPPSPSGITYPPCDVIWDARKDRIPFPDDSIDEVYAGYLLLHLGPIFHTPVLAEIRRVLKPGAPCLFGEVDMELVFLKWLQNPEDVGVSELVWGEQGSTHGASLADADKHCWGFTEGKLRNLLTARGFKDISRVRIHVAAVWYELTLRCTK
jgi:hypothetical protein